MPAMSQSGNSLWTQLHQSGSSPRDRFKHACCSYRGHVYMLGGRDHTRLRDFWRYSVVRNEWTELSCAGEAAPEELEEHSMVAHQGFLYVFGGLLESAYSMSRSAFWVFDIEGQKWIQHQRDERSPQARMPTNRKAHSAVVTPSAMLLYGGYVDMKGSSQELWSLRFESMAWSQLSGSQRGSLGPGPRHSHSAVVHQDCMYVFGGLKGLQEQRDFWRWNSSSRMWTSVRNKSGPSRLIGHSAVAYRDSMLLFGGGECPDSPKNCLWSYSFRTQTWGRVSVHPGSYPPSKIHHCCTGLGPSYECESRGPKPSDKPRPFKNRCRPAPLTFVGSDGAIELETFSPDKCYSSKALSDPSAGPENHQEQGEHCLTFENRSFRTRWSTTEEPEKDDDVSKHLPDLLLLLGGRPCSSHGPVSVWQVTLTDP